MEQNRLLLTGQILEIRNARISPAGVPQFEIVIEHRSRQMLSGKPREARLKMVVRMSGEAWSAVVATLAQGSRVRIEGFLANASHLDAEKQVLHAQALEITD